MWAMGRGKAFRPIWVAYSTVQYIRVGRKEKSVKSEEGLPVAFQLVNDPSHHGIYRPFPFFFRDQVAYKRQSKKKSKRNIVIKLNKFV